MRVQASRGVSEREFSVSHIGSENEAGRVAAAANRLRAVQADFADGDETSRKEFLLEEIDRALAGVVPDQRRVFLEQLQDRFPSWDMVDVKPPAAVAAGPGQSATDVRELRDWTFLVGKLTELAPTLSPQDRKAASARLPAPPAVGSGGGWSPQHAEALQAKLGLTPDEPLNANRMAEMLDLLLDASMGLDQLAWNTWKQIAPQSQTRRATPLQRVLGRFAVGDPEVPRTVAAIEVSRLRRLVAALISSVGQVGGKFAREFCGQFAPSQIEDVVKAQGGGGLFGNAKVKFWDQYVQMSATRDPASVEHDFVTAFAEYAELLMKSTGGR
jgi:hypothetical protein